MLRARYAGIFRKPLGKPNEIGSIDGQVRERALNEVPTSTLKRALRRLLGSGCATNFRKKPIVLKMR